MFLEILFTGLIVAGVSLYGVQKNLELHRRKSDIYLRMTLADYEEFLRGEQHVKQALEKANKQYAEAEFETYMAAEHVVTGLHLEYRQEFTGEDLSIEIAEVEESRKLLFGDKGDEE